MSPVQGVFRRPITPKVLKYFLRRGKAVEDSFEHYSEVHAGFSISKGLHHSAHGLRDWPARLGTSYLGPRIRNRRNPERVGPGNRRLDEPRSTRTTRKQKAQTRILVGKTLHPMRVNGGFLQNPFSFAWFAVSTAEFRLNHPPCAVWLAGTDATPFRVVDSAGEFPSVAPASQTLGLGGQ